MALRGGVPSDVWPPELSSFLLKVRHTSSRVGIVFVAQEGAGQGQTLLCLTSADPHLGGSPVLLGPRAGPGTEMTGEGVLRQEGGGGQYLEPLTVLP